MQDRDVPRSVWGLCEVLHGRLAPCFVADGCAYPFSGPVGTVFELLKLHVGGLQVPAASGSSMLHVQSLLHRWMTDLTF
jgi:hypothetical protein